MLTRRQALRLSACTAALTAVTRKLPAGVVASEGEALPEVRTALSFDEGWRFCRGDISDAQSLTFDDSHWRELDLPHDWRIEDLPYSNPDDGGATAIPSANAFNRTPTPEGTPPTAIGPFDANADSKPDVDVVIPEIGHVLMAGGRSQGYTVSGVAWYRKHFHLPKEHRSGYERDGSNRQVELRFDGVYQNADVWINGSHLGFHPNGYTSFAYDLTPHLDTKLENVIAVRVDNRGKTSRWYSGSGIYRHVWLTMSGPVNIPLWGVYVTTPLVDRKHSVVRIDVNVANAGVAAEACVRMSVMDVQGRIVGRQTSACQIHGAGTTLTHSAQIGIEDAALWSPETPNLYRVRSEVLIGRRLVDTLTTTFGIRSLVFNGKEGFLLNGKALKIIGGNIHHDHGPLGTIAIGRAEERKIEIMKAAGFNAIRIAHSPPSPKMLDACDRLGMLVYTEFSDMWDSPKLEDDYHLYFREWWERDLGGMVLRDRNHPSVIIWSIGNEIGADPNNFGPRLARLVRSLDSSRPIALGGMNVGAKGDPWSYVDIGDYHGAPPATDRAAHTDKAFLQSEDTAAQIYDDWKLAKENPWYVGSWVWAGWDYIGEAGGGRTLVADSEAEASGIGLDAAIGMVPYPWFNSFMADIDLIGQRKPQNYWRSVVNGFSPLELMVERPTPPGMRQFNLWYAYYDELPSWTWDAPLGKLMTVRVYTIGDSVTLLLNGKPAASKALKESDKRIGVFNIAYAPGELIAVAHLDGVEISRKVLMTAGDPAAIRLSSDVGSLTTGRDDLAHVLVEIMDARGRHVPDATVRVTFEIEGAGEIAGVGNGNPHNVDSFRRPSHWTWHGRALAILRPAKSKGTLTLTARAPGMVAARLKLQVTQAKNATAFQR
jgi:beta-galactosidase